MKLFNALTAIMVIVALSGGNAEVQSVAAQHTGLPGRVVDLRVGEYFILAPDSIPAGLATLRLTQTGDVTKPWPGDIRKLRADLTYHFHMVWLVRLDSGRTVSDLVQAERDRVPAPWATILGGPAFADTPGSSNATLVIPPGNYALVCYVGSAREDRNRYHLLKGMVRPLKVTGLSGSPVLPNAELTVVLRNDSTVMDGALKPGSYRILVRNDGEKPADFHIRRIKPGYTVEQARAWRPRMLTEPPGLAVGGVVWIKPKHALMTTVDIKAGNYLFGEKHIRVR